MHSFCFMIPCGLLAMVGGMASCLEKGSTTSLTGGASAGTVLLLVGFVILKSFKKRMNSYFAAHPDQYLCSLALTYVMGQRYLQTSKIMPAGVVAGLSATMTGFYLYKIATGGNHIPAKAE